MFSKLSAYFGTHSTSEVTPNSPVENSSNLPALALGSDAHYSRLGNDLSIKVAGEKFIVTDYFLHPTPLKTAQGETLSVDQVQTQLLPAPVMVADNSNNVPLEKIGTVSVLIKQPVEAKGLDGAVRLLKQGDAVYLHDTITTPVGGYLKITLQDGTTFQLGPLSRATLDKYSYDPNHVNAGGHFETTVAAGVFRFVSGKISGNNQGQHTLIKTPSAVIGIRGSELDIHVNADGSVVVVHSSGFVDVTPLFHPEQHLSLFEHGTTVYIPGDASSAPTVGISAPQFIQEFRNQLLPNNPYAPAPSGADALRHEGHGFEGDPDKPPPLPGEDRFGHGQRGEGKEPPPGSRPPEIMEFAKDHPEFRPPMPDDIGKAHWIMAGKNVWLDEHVNGDQPAFSPLNLSDRLQLDLSPNLPKDHDPRVLIGLLDKIDKIERNGEPLDHFDPNKPLPFSIFTEDNALVTQKLITPEQADRVTLVQPQFGTVINNYDGTFTYRPNSISFTGEDHFSYRVETPLGQRANPVRLSTTTDNFTEVTVDIASMVSFKLGTVITANDSAGNILLSGSITEFTQPEHGKLVLDEKTGAVIYVPSGRNFNGDDSFSYYLKASDSDAGVWVKADILVTHVNNEPVAVTDRFDEQNPIIPNKAELLTTLEDNSLLITQETLLKNDSDVDKYDVLRVLRVEPVAPTDGVTPTDVATHGSVFINPEGNIIYTPDPDYNGPATFKYTVADQFGARSTALVTVNVLPVNDAPVAKPIAFALNSQNIVDVPSVAVLTNVSDVDNEPSSLKLVGVSDALHGQVSLTADNRVVFVPDAIGDKFVTGEFNYTVSDGQLSSTGHALVLRDASSLPNVIPSVEPAKPQAVADLVQLSTLQPTVISAQQLLNNDVIPEGRSFKITAVSEGLNATVELTSTGDVQITPNASGEKLGIASFKYTATDNLGNSDVAIVAVNIPSNTTNPQVLLAHDDALNIASETIVKIAASSLLSNDFNPSGELIKITALGTASKGSVSLDSNNDVIFTRSADFNGVAEFDYQITSASGKTSSAHVILTGVTATGLLPQAQADNLGAQAKNQPVTIPVSQLLANDSDPQDASAVLNVQRVLTPVHGTVQLDATAQNVIFTPDPDYVGKAGFSYVVNNGTRSSLPAIVTLDMTNTPPQATTITGLSTGVNRALQITNKDILAAVSDADKGDVLTLKTVGNAVNGSVTLTPTGDVIFTPNKDYQGAASFQYTVVDSSQASSSAAVELKVSSGILIANPDSLTVPKNAESTLAAKDLLANDSAINPLTDKLSIVAASQPTQGGTSVSSAGDVVFIPQHGFVGKTEFQYTLQDNNGNQSVAKVTLDVVNHVPVAQPDNFAEPANTSTITLKVADLLVNDIDSDGDALKLTAVSNLSNGKVSLDAANGIISFVPDATVTHTGGVASFNYSIADDTGGTAQGIVNFNFASNQAPVVSLSSTSALTYKLGDAALTVDSAARVSDIDNNVFNQGLLKISVRNPLSGDSLEVHNIGGISTVSPSGGALVFDGKTIGSFSSSSSDLSVQLNENADIPATTALLQAVTYKNTTVDNSAFTLPTGIRTLDISLNDGAGGVSALVSRDINVESTSKPPTAVADTLSKSFGMVTSIPASDLLANDVNPNPSELLTLSNVSNFSAGVNARLVNNEVQLFIDAFSGSTEAHFDYSIVNGSGNTSTATVTIKADNLVIGTPNADTFTDYNKTNFTIVEGLEGNDSFGLSSGAAKLFGGAGNDSFNFDPSASAGLSIDGGTGTDTVTLNNATGKTIDLTQNASLPSDQQYSLHNIDVINIATGSAGNNTLRLGISDVLNITDNKSLTIEGNAGSVVISPGQGWINQGASAVGNYTRYSAGGAELLVSNEINAQFIS